MKKVIYFKVALQNTSDCVLGDNGNCVLAYTAPALVTYEQFIVMLENSPKKVCALIG